MSDEYGSASGGPTGGFGGSLVNDSMDTQDTRNTVSNNPPNDPSDSTSSGGYGGSADSFSDSKQRGSDASSRGQLGQGRSEPASQQGPPNTLADQNPRGEAGVGLSDGLNPYGASADAPPSSSKTADRREDEFESGPGASMEQDAGA